jgi:Domain of unknown function (DUF4429)
MFAEGSNGSVELFDNHIVIRRKGFANVLTQGIQGDKSIPLSSITAVQFRPVGSLMAGLIQFTLLGGREFRGGMLEATKDENAVLFIKEQEPVFVELQKVVQGAISRRVNAPSAQQPSVADELVKLADLVEKGYLTRDEYDEKKQALLASASPTPSSTRTTSSANSIRTSAAVVNTDNDELRQTSASKKRNPFIVGCLIIAAAFVVLIVVLGQLGSNLVSEPAHAGKNWKVVGGLNDGQNMKFVAVDQAGLGGDFYNEAIQQLCPSAECAYVGFFTPGDKIPPSTSSSEFFERGGWKEYRPAAVYLVNGFTKWDCDKAGYANAPEGSLCDKVK